MHHNLVMFNESTPRINRNGTEKGVSVSMRVPATVNEGGTTPNGDPSHAWKERELLAELFGLLEDYGPAWYTEELHNRIEALLKNQ